MWEAERCDLHCHWGMYSVCYARYLGNEKRGPGIKSRSCCPLYQINVCVNADSLPQNFKANNMRKYSDNFRSSYLERTKFVSWSTQAQAGSFASRGVVSSLTSSSSRRTIMSPTKDKIWSAASWGGMLVMLRVRP